MIIFKPLGLYSRKQDLIWYYEGYLCNKAERGIFKNTLVCSNFNSLSWVSKMESVSLSKAPGVHKSVHSNKVKTLQMFAGLSLDFSPWQEVYSIKISCLLKQQQHINKVIKHSTKYTNELCILKHRVSPLHSYLRSEKKTSSWEKTNNPNLPPANVLS